MEISRNSARLEQIACSHVSLAGDLLWLSLEEAEMKRKAIGDILLEMGAIDELQLQSALAHQRQWGMPLGQAMVEKRFCSRDQLLAALSLQTRMKVVDLSKEQLGKELGGLLPQKVAEQHRAVPLRVEGARGDVLVVAIAAPAALSSLDDIQAASGKRRVEPLLADDASIERALGLVYRGYAEALTPDVAPLSRAMQREEVEFDLDKPRKQRPVMVFGWTPEAGRTLSLILAADGISARVVTPREVLEASPEDVIVAPLPAIEALVPAGQRSPGRLVVAGKSPEDDLPRAQLLGARGFITAPVDTALLLRSVRRCQALTPAGPAPHAA